MAKEADIGLIGLAVMGQNLILNFNDHGYRVCCYNRTVSKVETFMNEGAKGTKIIGAKSIVEFVKNLKRPRKIIMMVRAGDAVDELINELLPHLEEGDILMDGGNSHFPDTMRRCKELEKKKILYMGTGISGGEEGARFGPSIMPGGNSAAWKYMKEPLQAISAKTDSGDPCCDWVGEGGAGHFVKMVHNGIEYSDIQIIAESVEFMRKVLGMDERECAKVFEEWNKGELNSFLIESTAKVLAYEDKDGKPIISKIMDKAQQKGTGLWTAQASLDEGIPVNSITEAVYARFLSQHKDMRIKLSKIYRMAHKLCTEDKKLVLDHLKKAVYSAKLVSYVQGYMLMKDASDRYKWDLNFGGIAIMWMKGCIIRCKFLEDIRNAYKKNPKLENLMMDDFFKKELMRSHEGWRHSIARSATFGVPMPCITACMSFFDAMIEERGSAYVVSAIRDFFGAHTVELMNKPGEFVHIDWENRGDTGATAGTYSF